jgi:hypothetical protein
MPRYAGFIGDMRFCIFYLAVYPLTPFEMVK